MSLQEIEVQRVVNALTVCRNYMTARDISIGTVMLREPRWQGWS